MKVKFKCGGCGQKLSTDSEKAGSVGPCPKCGTPVEILPLTMAMKILRNVVYLIAFAATAAFIAWFIDLGKPKPKPAPVDFVISKPTPSKYEINPDLLKPVIPKALGAEPFAQQVGEILVPPPKGMVDVADYSDFFRKMVSAYPKKPFGLYYLVSEFNAVEGGTLSASSRTAVGNIGGIFGTAAEAKFEFSKTMTETEKELAKLKFSSADFQKYMAEGKKSAAASFPALKVGVEGMAVLEMDFTRPTRCVVIAVVNGSVTVDGARVEGSLLYCTGYQLVGKTILYLTFGMPMKDESSPTVARAALEEWMDAIAKKNAKPTAAPEDVSKISLEKLERVRRDAERGLAEAESYLGACYASGSGVPKDATEAVKWYRKAADQGLSAAQWFLGGCYAKGTGVPKDDAEAAKWYRKAADQGLANAQWSLGACYGDGAGVKEDWTEAVRWSRKAAEQGNTEAQLFLGACYAEGAGVSKDNVVSYMWASLAATAGYTDAKKILVSLSKQMTPGQITEAQRMSREWKPKKEDSGK